MKKTILVTGSSNGIGAAAVEAFAKDGYDVGINYCNSPADAEEVAARCCAYGADAQVYQADVSKREDCERMMNAFLEHFGRIDVLVNNAAGKLPAGEFADISNEAWLSGWNQKLQCHIRACRAAYPVMQAQKSGVIVNVLGTAARNPKASYMPVGISNAALYNFTKSFADLCAPQGIRVLGVAPSGVTTGRWTRLVAARAPAEGKTPEQLQAEVDAALPLGRMAHPQDVANAVCFAASDRASYICGSVITVDGNSTQGVYL